MDREKQIKLFITGLCLQGNKGGPALAISLRDSLGEYLNLDIITLSVPGDADFVNEQRAAIEYGFKVVQVISPSALIPPFCFLNKRIRKANDWLKVLKSSDVVIDMTAISYVGPPFGSGVRAVIGGRFMYFVLALLFKKKFLAWTQSYGPLSTLLIRTLAKFDLQRQPVIFCRGEDCAAAVRKILPKKDVRSFPDVATTLKFDKYFGFQYLAKRFECVTDRLVTISPSAVIYSKAAGRRQRNEHVKQCVDLCDWLANRGHTVALVPHTLRLTCSSPKSCDLEVCKLIKMVAKDSAKIILIDEDLGADQLKSVISNAFVHIGGRYHSVVAALSTGVPCISLSWHPKYRDLMRAYKMETYVFDARGNLTSGRLIDVTEQLLEGAALLKKSLLERQEKIASLVSENARLLSSLV